MKENISITPDATVPNRLLRVMAWVGILAIFTPVIILRLVVRDLPAEPLTPFWLRWTQLGFLAVLSVVTLMWPAVRPLRGFYLALLAFLAGDLFIGPYVRESAAWAKWIDQAPWGVWIMVLFGTRLLTVGLMALTLVGSGIGRRALFLVRGDPSAPSQPSRLMPGVMEESKPWNLVAREFLPVYVIIMLIVIGIQVRPILSQFSKVVIYLPAIIIAAATNAFAEEFEFRSMLLSRLGTVLGSGQAILMTSVLFGLGHYYGWPGGPLGVILAAYLGWVAAKSMVETRGFVWAFALHFLGDFVVYSFWAMAGTRF